MEEPTFDRVVYVVPVGAVATVPSVISLGEEV
jgi:hypothetical protein